MDKKRVVVRDENFDDPNVDCFEQAAMIRKELTEGDPPMPEPHLEWLDQLDHLHRELNRNVIQSACIDNSPTLIFDRVATPIINEMTAEDTIGEIGQRMVEEGFDAIHEMLQHEGELIEERVQILQQMRTMLLDHRSDYTADLLVDDESIDCEFEVPIFRERPKTAFRSA
jgi:hypothetical protein